jgi:hypothetical protein
MLIGAINLSLKKITENFGVAENTYQAKVCEGSFRDKASLIFSLLVYG